MNETLEQAGKRLYPNRESFLHRFQNIERKAFTAGAEWQAKITYTEQEVLHILDTLWDRLDRWYNEDADKEFSLRKWFDECELKKK
jgi:hypothetical protein